MALPVGDALYRFQAAYVTHRQPENHDYALSKPNSLCNTRVASSKYFSSISTETLISEVEIIWMLMFSDASAWNIHAAMLTCERMPKPSIDTLHTASSPLTSAAPMLSFRLPSSSKVGL